MRATRAIQQVATMNTWDRLNRERHEYLTQWSGMSPADKAQSMAENKVFWDELFDDTKLDDHFEAQPGRARVDVLCMDGVTLSLPPHAVRQCATLKHMLGDCSGQDVAESVTPVPLHSAAVLRLCSLVDHAAEVAAWDTDDLLDVARAADFLAHEDALRAVCAELGKRLAADTTLLDGWDLPCHLVCLVAHNLQLEALCQLVLRRVELGAVLKPRMLTLAADVTLSSASAAGHLGVCRWLAETFHLTPDDARAEHNYALRLAAYNGHLDVCRWLTETFHLTAADARAQQRCTTACGREGLPGRVPVAHRDVPPDA
jgi:hypothetical protein